MAKIALGRARASFENQDPVGIARFVWPRGCELLASIIGEGRPSRILIFATCGVVPASRCRATQLRHINCDRVGRRHVNNHQRTIRRPSGRRAGIVRYGSDAPILSDTAKCSCQKRVAVLANVGCKPSNEARKAIISGGDDHMRLIRNKIEPVPRYE